MFINIGSSLSEMDYLEKADKDEELKQFVLSSNDPVWLKVIVQEVTGKIN